MAEIELWRLTRRAYAEAAYDGEGARLYGGRWNRVGIPVAYASGSLSLALLEVLVQVTSPEHLGLYVAVPAWLDERYVEGIPSTALPEDWRALPAPASTRAYGAAWAQERRSLVLRVPSVVVPRESNYVLNPRHADFGALVVGDPEPVEIDPRLLRTG